MECNKSRESRKGYARRRGGRKEEKREFRRLKNSKGEEPPAWPRFSVADVEDTMSVVEQETSLALENFYGGKSEVLCSSFLSLPVDRRERERVRAFFVRMKYRVKARYFAIALRKKDPPSDESDAFYVN